MKNKRIIFTIGIILISILYLFIRFYNLNNLIGFRLDQGIHLLETKTMFDTKKISLVGPMVTSKTYMGRQFFIGPNYYYVLGIIGFLGQWDPMKITIIFIFLELGFYLFFIFFLKQKFNQFWSLFIFLFLSISPYLIIHSRFFWNPHLLIPLSILLLFLGDKFLIKKQIKYLFLTTICWGFGFACHYSAVFWGLWLIYLLVKSKQFKNFRVYLIIILGFVLGDLPWFIFEMRHSFYNTKTMIYVFLNSNSGSELTSHYFVFSLLVLIIFGLLLLINKDNIWKIILIIILLGSFLLQIKIYRNYAPLDVIEGWNYKEQQKVASLIVKNGCPKNFNIATTIQGDTRAYDLRFLLTAKGCKPMGVEEYPSVEKLFLIAPVNRPPETETVWEVSSLGKYKINRQEKLTENILFWELEKIK